MSSTLFDDIFNIESIDSARYDRVSRIIANSTSSQDTKITLDINHELFPVSSNDTLTITLAKSLSIEDDSEMDGEGILAANGSWRPPKPDQRSLMNDYDYVMHGTVYKFEEGKDDKIYVYCSFGGLLMCLEGNYRNLSSLKQENLYILMRK
ncbi:DNA-directed RNA polymerases I, II, and III subunit RPABC3 [Pichia californica]|uniref:DNA-directed RNA polymerases I, II, and III subunit RPABC3 n=1 Tax=Pichia californica TaxID=460514 RepID=A0A9P6WGW7_9ASCO|nr:DNA-directed RNA polymerases I, II, and III subunit RPABC3 [[Candida] californica]KAG0686636.1 DNA-directed RNA polymerases I, II, and III subunit RPABC3 [[Candida] californica]